MLPKPNIATEIFLEIAASSGPSQCLGGMSVACELMPFYTLPSAIFKDNRAADSSTPGVGSGRGEVPVRKFCLTGGGTGYRVQGLGIGS